MTQIEVSLCGQDYMRPFPERSITVEKDSGNECNNSFSLRTGEERASLLKAGYSGKDIESEYINRNGISVIGINWQD